jgi:tRNA(fMet)-specific endonuclease VapC
MSLYILDTDILSLLQDGDLIVRQRVGSHPANEVAITVISVEEQLRGWYTKLRRARTPPMLAQANERLTRNVRFLT